MQGQKHNIIKQFRENKVLRIFLASSIAFLIFIIIVFLAQAHKRVKISDALNNITDSQLKSCIKDNAEKQNALFSYELKELICPLKLNSYNQPLYIKDLTGLSQFYFLETLDLSNAKINSLKHISPITSLKDLKLSSANIFVIDDLSSLIHLERLDLSENSIRDASALSHLIKLERINLSNNNISDLEFASNLIKLKALILRSNLISSVEGLKSHKQLIELDLSNNSIYNIHSLSSLRHLEKLNLSQNKIQVLSSLSKLLSLKNLNLSENKIEDVSALAKLTPNKLNLTGNNISIGVRSLYNESEQKNYPDRVLINMEGNDRIPCREIQILESKLAEIDNMQILEPKVCSEKILPIKKKRSIWKFWNR
jgi:hypothetical protein